MGKSSKKKNRHRNKRKRKGFEQQIRPWKKRKTIFTQMPPPPERKPKKKMSSLQRLRQTLPVYEGNDQQKVRKYVQKRNFGSRIFSSIIL